MNYVDKQAHFLDENTKRECLFINKVVKTNSTQFYTVETTRSLAKQQICRNVVRRKESRARARCYCKTIGIKIARRMTYGD